MESVHAVTSSAMQTRRSSLVLQTVLHLATGANLTLVARHEGSTTTFVQQATLSFVYIASAATDGVAVSVLSSSFTLDASI